MAKWELNPKYQVQDIEIRRQLEIQDISFSMNGRDENSSHPEYVYVKARITLPGRWDSEGIPMSMCFPFTKTLKKLFYAFCRREIEKILKKEHLMPPKKGKK